MKIITIEEEAWQQLNSRINAIADYLKGQEDKSFDDLWLNNHEVCQYLHISEKTLWRMRTKGEIAYSKIYGQYFYTIGAIKDMLNANAIQSNDEFVQELIFYLGVSLCIFPNAQQPTAQKMQAGRAIRCKSSLRFAIVTLRCGLSASIPHAKRLYRYHKCISNQFLYQDTLFRWKC